MFNYGPQNNMGYETTLCDSCGLHNPSHMIIKNNFYALTPDAWRRSTDMYNLPYPISLGDTQQCAALYFQGERLPSPCHICRKDLKVTKTFNIIPSMFELHLGIQALTISHRVVVNLISGTYTFGLKGMIYFGGYHFTSQFVDKDDNVWYHDGIETGHRCEFQGSLHAMTNDMILKTHNKVLCTVIYQIL